MGLDSFSRTELLLGPLAMERLAASTVAVFGLGGVGSWAAESLARSGIGGLVLVDDDSVCLTNINRQAPALRSTIGRPKAEVVAERLRDINPDLRLEVHAAYYSAATAPSLLRPGLSYVIDAIDTVSSKLDLIVRSQGLGLPVVSALGAGNKLDPTLLKVADIYTTTVCPLARVMRRELRRRGVEALTVVYSTEAPILVDEAANPCRSACVCPKKDRTCVGRRSVPGSSSFVPPAAGLVLASVVVRALIADLPARPRAGIA